MDADLDVERTVGHDGNRLRRHAALQRADDVQLNNNAQRGVRPSAAAFAHVAVARRRLRHATVEDDIGQQSPGSHVAEPRVASGGPFRCRRVRPGRRHEAEDEGGDDNGRWTPIHRQEHLSATANSLRSRPPWLTDSSIFHSRVCLSTYDVYNPKL